MDFFIYLSCSGVISSCSSAQVYALMNLLKATLSQVGCWVFVVLFFNCLIFSGVRGSVGEMLLFLGGPALSEEDSKGEVHVPGPGAAGGPRVATEAPDNNRSQSFVQREWSVSGHHHRE